MKKFLLSPGLLIVLFILLLPPESMAGRRLTEQQALDILAEQIDKDKLYDSRISLSCLFFITEVKSENYFDFAIREKHGGECPGEPNTSPIVDRFRIDRISKEIQRYDVIMAQFVPYSTMFE